MFIAPSATLNPPPVPIVPTAPAVFVVPASFTHTLSLYNLNPCVSALYCMLPVSCGESYFAVSGPPSANVDALDALSNCAPTHHILPPLCPLSGPPTLT